VTSSKTSLSAIKTSSPLGVNQNFQNFQPTTLSIEYKENPDIVLDAIGHRFLE
jgi:hypothetical protein